MRSLNSNYFKLDVLSFCVMKKSFTIGLLVAALSVGCGGGSGGGTGSGGSGSSSGGVNTDGVEYFNPNSQVVIVDSSKSEKVISYDSLVDVLYESRGEMSIPVVATSVALYEHGILNQRYALAWTVRLQGEFQNVGVELLTIDVDRGEFGILDNSYGYASERSMSGNIGGNKFVLSCTKKNVDVQGFLNQRYGMAYSEELRGSLGDDVEVILQSVPGTKIDGILDNKFGYSWINSGTLVLRACKQMKYF